MWDERTGFLHQDDDDFDTECSVHLRPLAASGKAGDAAATSKEVDNSRHPRCVPARAVVAGHRPSRSADIRWIQSIECGRWRMVSTAAWPRCGKMAVWLCGCRYNLELELLDEAIDQQLDFVVKNARSAHDLRAVGHRLGVAHVPLPDIARCPDGKVRLARACCTPRYAARAIAGAGELPAVPRCCCVRPAACAAQVQINGHAMQVVEATLDLRHPHDPSVTTGVLVVSLEWIPLNEGLPIPPPSPLLPTLTTPTRGDLFVRVVRARALPAMDARAHTSNASVRLRSTGQEHVTSCAEGLAPVWGEVARFDGLAPHSSVHVSVQHEPHRRISESGRLESFVSRPVRASFTRRSLCFAVLDSQVLLRMAQLTPAVSRSAACNAAPL